MVKRQLVEVVGYVHRHCLQCKRDEDCIAFSVDGKHNLLCKECFRLEYKTKKVVSRWK